MEMKYKLESINHKETEAGDSWTYKYIPTLDRYAKKCSFSISTKEPYQDLGNLNLPKSINNTIVMDWKPKGKQEKIKDK